MRTTLISMIAVISALCGSEANARPANEIETVYYASSARKPGEEVGWTRLNCYGPFEREGVSSPYYVRWISSCGPIAACSTDEESVACSADVCDRMASSKRCKKSVKK